MSRWDVISWPYRSSPMETAGQTTMAAAGFTDGKAAAEAAAALRALDPEHAYMVRQNTGRLDDWEGIR